jgi:hypothetical protein
VRKRNHQGQVPLPKPTKYVIFVTEEEVYQDAPPHLAVFLFLDRFSFVLATNFQAALTTLSPTVYPVSGQQ